MPRSPVILVVDDNEALRRLLTHTLFHDGCHLLEGANGREALEVASRIPGQIDLLICDIAMPDMDGLELSDRFLKEQPNTPVLFISGVFGASAVAPRLEGRTAGFLAKPFDMRDLRQVVGRLLGRAFSSEAKPLASVKHSIRRTSAAQRNAPPAR